MEETEEMEQAEKKSFWWEAVIFGAIFIALGIGCLVYEVDRNAFSGAEMMTRAAGWALLSFGWVIACMFIDEGPTTKKVKIAIVLCTVACLIGTLVVWLTIEESWRLLFDNLFTGFIGFLTAFMNLVMAYGAIEVLTKEKEEEGS